MFLSICNTLNSKNMLKGNVSDHLMSLYVTTGCGWINSVELNNLLPPLLLLGACCSLEETWGPCWRMYTQLSVMVLRAPCPLEGTLEGWEETVQEMTKIDTLRRTDLPTMLFWRSNRELTAMISEVYQLEQYR